MYFVVNPVYKDLLALGYIKVAKALQPVLTKKLNDLFPNPNKVKIAPIKDLRRCQAKLEDARKAHNTSSFVLEYGRETQECVVHV
jgi:hypothetical protein